MPKGAIPFDSPPKVNRGSKPPTKKVPAYALFSKPELGSSTPNSPQSDTNKTLQPGYLRNTDPEPKTPAYISGEYDKPPETKFWVCVALSSGIMVKVRCASNETAETFRESVIEQLEDFTKQLKRKQQFTIQKPGLQEPVSLPETLNLINDSEISQTLQQQKVPILFLPQLPVEYNNPKLPQIKSSPSILEGKKEQNYITAPLLSPDSPVFSPRKRSGSKIQKRNMYQDVLDSIPASFEGISQEEKEKKQEIFIESILVQSYAKLKAQVDDEESQLFKDTIFPVSKKLQPREKLTIPYAGITYLPWPETLNQSFSATFNYPSANVAKTIDIKYTDKSEDIIKQLISGSHIGSIRSKSFDSVSLKFCDYNEYLHPKMQFGMCLRLREYLKRRTRIQFSIVDNDQLISIYGPLGNYEEFYQPRTSVDLFSLSAPPIPAKNSVTSTDLDYNFQIRILQVENFAASFPLYCEQDAGYNSFSVSIELCHGLDHLAPPEWSEAQRDVMDFDQWIGIETLRIHQIPRSTKVCITLYVKNFKEMVPLGWVNIQLFNYFNILKTGSFTLPLWLNGKANPLGTCALNTESRNPVTITVEFPPYSDNLVTYPSFSRYIYTSKEPVKEDPTVVLNARLEYLLDRDPLHHLTDKEKSMLWDNRQFLTCVPKALPKVIQCVDWKNQSMILEMVQLMAIWAPLKGNIALQLLDAHYPAPEVREYAINCLRSLPDCDLQDYLLQLVQVLKYEPFHDCPLSRFLLQRALQNREQIGHLLFWYLKAELSMPTISHRYTLLLEAYLYGSGDHLLHLVHQTQLVEKLHKIAEIVKSKKKGRQTILEKELQNISLTENVNLPIVPTMTISGFNASKCKVMDSFTLPLWLDCKCNDPFGRPVKMIFKTGDDLRADILMLQMFRLMDKLWQSEGLDMHLSPYMCISTDTEAGMIEVVQDAVTTASIQKERGVVTGALKKTPLAKWLKEKNPSDVMYDQAVDNFVASLAGYCVATYILGIGDRHNDNIMITSSGFLFHIDFAHILGNVQTWQGIKRERAPFVLTPEFLYVMGKRKSPKYKRFVNICCKAFNVLRKHANLFISLFSMMLSTGIPELKADADINYLRNAFYLGKTNKEAAKYFIGLIDESLNTKATQVNFLIHNLAHVAN